MAEPWRLPPATRRLFAHYDAGVLDRPRARVFIALRLAEEGDRRDLRALVAGLGEAELRRILSRHGRRHLSRRSRAFWRRVLDLPAGERAGDDLAAELWPG